MLPLQETDKVRDLTIWKVADDNWIVIATDSLGGIGQQPFDEVEASPQDIGYFTTRVVLFELMAAHVTPCIIINTLSVGGEYAGKIVDGIREAVLEAGLGQDFSITGSCEDNVPAKLTALGVTGLGRVNRETFGPGKAEPKDEVWLVGKPKSAPGDKVSRHDTTTVSFSQLNVLQQISNLHEILPVGSKGALFEARQLASTAGLRWSPFPNTNRELCNHSAGPATAVLVAGKFTNESDWHELQAQLPCTRLGILE